MPQQVHRLFLSHPYGLDMLQQPTKGMWRSPRILHHLLLSRISFCIFSAREISSCTMTYIYNSSVMGWSLATCAAIPKMDCLAHSVWTQQSHQSLFPVRSSHPLSSFPPGPTCRSYKWSHSAQTFECAFKKFTWLLGNAPLLVSLLLLESRGEVRGWGDPKGVVGTVLSICQRRMELN